MPSSRLWPRSWSPISAMTSASSGSSPDGLNEPIQATSGSREGVDLGVHMAVVERRRPVADAARRSRPWPRSIAITASFAPVAARVRLEHEAHMNAAVARPDQRLGQRPIAEVIGRPVDPAARRSGLDMRLRSRSRKRRGARSGPPNSIGPERVASLRPRDARRRGPPCSAPQAPPVERAKRRAKRRDVVVRQQPVRPVEQVPRHDRPCRRRAARPPPEAGWHPPSLARRGEQ